MRKAFSLSGAAMIGALALGLAGTAGAQLAQRPVDAPPAQPGQSYPRTYGSGENIMVDYGPMGQAALVGGGRVMVSSNSGMNVDIVHLDAMFVQQPREGFVPLTIGSGEGQETIWVPAMMLDRFRQLRNR